MARQVRISDLLNATTTTDETCVRRLARLNHILNVFFFDIIETNASRVGECFTGAGEILLTPKYPIAKLHGFFGKGKGKCFYDLHRECQCGTCNICLTKGIHLAESEYYLDNYQWRKDENGLMIRIDCGVLDGYYVYSRGADQINSINDRIDLDIELEYGLVLLLEIFYSEYAEQFQKASYYRTLYTSWLTKMRENVDDIPTYIGRSVLPTY